MKAYEGDRHTKFLNKCICSSPGHKQYRLKYNHWVYYFFYTVSGPFFIWEKLMFDVPLSCKFKGTVSWDIKKFDKNLQNQA
jgi:hypothetical protein